ncbi:START domain-containing protein [Plasmodiophora brassicae]
MTTLTALALPLGDLRDQASNVPQAAPVINNGCSDPDVAQRDDDLAQTFIRRFEGVLDLVARSKILRAEMELAQLNDMAAALPRTTTTSSTKLQECLEMLKTNDAIARVQKSADEVRKLVQQAKSSDPTWVLNLENTKRSMKTFHRMDQEAGILSLKVEARRIHCSVFDLLTLLNEFDLLGAILTNPLVKIEIDPLYVDKLRKLMHARVKPIWPFGARDAVVDVAGFDVLDQGCICILGQSFESVAELNISAPPVPSACTRVAVRWSGAVIRPIQPNLTSMVAILNVDLRVSVLPQKFINFVARQLSMPILTMFVDRAESISDSEPHQERIRTNANGTYDVIREALVGFDYENAALVEVQMSSEIDDDELCGEI